jgi:NitT/TauT family transport system ATP-binding protein
MDEPFSSLVVLTAENLRNDLIDLWQEESHMKGILFVTHNIEEAVLVADRILVFGNNPGHIRGELKVDLPYPRNSQDKKVSKLIDEVYMLMTSAHIDGAKNKEEESNSTGLGWRLPDCEISELLGLLESVDELQGKGPVDLPDLTEEIRLDIDDLFPVLESLSVLGFAKVSKGDISISKLGKQLVEADITDRKVIFAKALLKNVPLARHIQNALESKTSHRISEDKFKKELSGHFTESEAERVLTTLIEWSRYAEILAYDYNTGMLSLEDVE